MSVCQSFKCLDARRTVAVCQSFKCLDARRIWQGVEVLTVQGGSVVKDGKVLLLVFGCRADSSRVIRSRRFVRKATVAGWQGLNVLCKRE